MSQDVRWIATQDALAELVRRLQMEPIIAVDTESNSFYVYHQQVCLLQFSVPGRDYLVDPLALDDLSPLASIFADPGREKVFHAAEYDVMCLKRDFGFPFANLFDTMIASRIVGRRRFGLSALLEEHFGVCMDKRMQRFNWARRPLPLDAVAYAALDTRYLIPLRQLLLAELEALGRVEEAREAFEKLCRLPPAEKAFDPEGFWRIRGARELTPRQAAVLRELYLYREARAGAENRAPFRVLSNALLVRLSRLQPATLDELRRVRGMTEHLTRRHGRGILRAIRRGQRGPDLRPPPPDQSRRPDDATLARFEALRQWRKRKAAQRGVEPEMVLSNAVLWALARNVPRDMAALEALQVMGPWQLQAYGPELLKVLEIGY